MIKREAILASLATTLALDRNTPIGEFKSTWRSLSDGELEKTEEFLNGPIFEWQARPVLVLAVEGGTPAERNAAMSALIEAQVALLDTARQQLITAGLIDDLRAVDPDFSATDLWGAVGVKAADLTIEIDYWSDQSVG
ncbi:MAG TPA: hypothetical protein VGN60_00785 [Devosia sp.]|jgi:hypothetical protein|nr:hypothetical protein [Devosia sp.]